MGPWVWATREWYRVDPPPHIRPREQVTRGTGEGEAAVKPEMGGLEVTRRVRLEAARAQHVQHLLGILEAKGLASDRGCGEQSRQLYVGGGGESARALRATQGDHLPKLAFGHLRGAASRSIGWACGYTRRGYGWACEYIRGGAGARELLAGKQAVGDVLAVSQQPRRA